MPGLGASKISGSATPEPDGIEKIGFVGGDTAPVSESEYYLHWGYIWGSDAAAATGNADSMHVTNAVPQMQPFNAGIWLGLEDYALDHAREDDMRISVFTGPFLRSNDPERFGVRIPVRFWKVIAFVHDETGELCATGYTMSQKNFIGEEEFVFGAHETAQAAIRSIEEQAGLSFGPLADLDPFADVEESIERPLLDFREIRFTRR